MTRLADRGSLSLPRGSRIVADFTDGSIPASAIVFDSGLPAASGRAYKYDNNGVEISISGGTTGQYASFKWEPSIASPGATIDLSGSDYLALECEWPYGTGAVYNSVSVFLTTQTGTTYTNYRNRSLTSGAAKTPLNQLMLTRFSADTWALVGGGPLSLASLGKFEVRFGVHASAQNIPASIRIKRIWMGRNRPKLMFSFDDSMDGQLNYALPSLTAKGWVGILNVSPSQLGAAGRLTNSNLQTFYDAGWDLGVQQYNDTADVPIYVPATNSLTSDGAGTATWINNNNLAHNLVPGNVVVIEGAMSDTFNGAKVVLSTPNAYTFTYAISGTPTTPDPGSPSFPRLSKEEAFQTWNRSISYLRSLGFSRGRNFAAHSSGISNPTTRSWMEEWGFQLARGTRINTAPNIGFDPRSLRMQDFLNLPAVSMDQQTASTVLGRVDTCIERGCSVILYGHDIDPTPAALTITQSEWNAMVSGISDRVNRGLIDVVSTSEFHRMLVNGRS